ncbi:unnamed protein product [Somion occarium]|uniref:F-box domain-containing protein n=1 Tax=Somion occarium TaxID=3059160 RepID=A0ABP1CUW5_9APHY
MGTRGYRVYRHKGKYFISYNHFDSYPEGLGVQLLQEIPTDPEEFELWVQHHRQMLDQELEAFLSAGGERDAYNSDLRIEDEAPRNDLFIEWIYEMDFDRMIFHVDSHPVYRLDHMPPEDVFLEGIDFDRYNNRACADSVPAEYRYIIRAAPTPSLSHHVLEVYNAYKADVVALPIHQVLHRSHSLSHQETVCKHFLELIVGSLIVNEGRSLHFLDEIPNREAFSVKHLEILRSLIEASLFPSAFAGYEAKDNSDKEMSPSSNANLLVDFWWIRRHICVRFTTHLQHESGLRSAIAELATEIFGADAGPQPIVYGVAFSISHIVIARFDKPTKRLVHTECLPFLPSFYADSPSTPGITAMTYLASVPAEDDSSWFLQRLTHIYTAPTITSCQAVAHPVASTHTPSLPTEIWMRIISFIDDPYSLSALARASRRTMAIVGASDWLRYPRIRVSDRVSEEFIALCVLQDVAPSPDSFSEECKYLFSAAFETIWQELYAVVFLSAVECPILDEQDESYTEMAMVDIKFGAQIRYTLPTVIATNAGRSGLHEDKMN